MVHTIDTHFLDTPRSIAVFAIPDEEGHTLVETGPFSTHAALLSGMAKLGIDPGSVHSVLLTHIHFDHAGAAWWWAERGARIYVHPRGHKHMVNPERLYNSARQIYGDRMEQLWGKMRSIAEERVTAVEDRATFTIGGHEWVSHHTPGHASHHIAWQLDGSVFTGDVGGCRIDDGPVVPPCPPPDIDREAWLDSIERLRELDADAFYLTHYGKMTDTDSHLEELGERLQDYIEWMAPHYRAGTDPAALQPLFKRYVTEDLLTAGMPQSDLPAYLAANPPGMSVAGILRYLHKQARS